MARAQAGPGHAIELRRAEIERINNTGAQYFKASGEIQVNGTGEAAISVAFPIYFSDKPLLSTGFELGPGQPFVPGNLPVCSATVLRWEERVRDDGTVVFAGAVFGIVTSGPEGQVTVLQWHVEGTGLRGPVEED
jgi:hypothetical protein